VTENPALARNDPISEANGPGVQRLAPPGTECGMIIVFSLPAVPRYARIPAGVFPQVRDLNDER
jgi:hypothetical protein